MLIDVHAYVDRDGDAPHGLLHGWRMRENDRNAAALLQTSCLLFLLRLNRTVMVALIAGGAIVALSAACTMSKDGYNVWRRSQ
jgi:hypothetical protein